MDRANSFYGNTLGLLPRPVPHLQKGRLAWFDIGASGQQIHIAYESNETLTSSRHPCFRVESPEMLLLLRQRIYDYYVRADVAAPLEADKPGEENSGLLVDSTHGTALR